MFGHIADDVLPGLGPHHHPAEHPVPLRRARAGPRRDARPRRRSASPPARRAATPSATCMGCHLAGACPLRGARHHARGPRPPSSTSCATRSPSACPASSRSTSPAARPTAARRCSTTSASSPPPARSTTARVEPGFRVFVAGGLGANPHPALALEEFTAREDLLPTIEAILRVFDQHGNRDNKLRARMKWLVDTLGWDELQAPRSSRSASSCSASSSWPGGIPDERRRSTATRPPGVADGVTPDRRSARARPVTHHADASPTSAGTTPTSSAASPRAPCRPYAYAAPRRHHLRPVPGAGRRSSASSAPRCGSPTARTSCSAASPRTSCRALYERLDAIGMAEPGAELARDVVACPGADTCNLAVTQSPRPGRRHRRRASRRRAWPRSAASAPTSPAAPTSCGQHHIVRHRLLRRRAPGPRPVRPRLPDAARRLRRPGEDPLRREGAAPAGQERARGRRAGRRRFADEREAGERSAPGWTAPAAPRRSPTSLKDLDEFPTPEEAPEYYVDYGETGPYVAEIGDSECAT